jgi:hypothetical protein
MIVTCPAVSMLTMIFAAAEAEKYHYIRTVPGKEICRGVSNYVDRVARAADAVPARRSTELPSIYTPVPEVARIVPQPTGVPSVE